MRDKLNDSARLGLMQEAVSGGISRQAAAGLAFRHLT